MTKIDMVKRTSFEYSQPLHIVEIFKLHPFGQQDEILQKSENLKLKRS